MYVRSNIILVKYFIILKLIFTVSSCDPFDIDNAPNNNNGENRIVSPDEVSYYSEDKSGNIYILNRIDEPIYLYSSEKLIKIISPYSGQYSKFLVKINNQMGASNLKIWRRSDIQDFRSPPNDLLYRQWDVVLSQNTDESERAIWLIEDSANDKNVGTLTFNYPSKGVDNLDVIYSVDIYLQRPIEGTRITAVSPGTQEKKVGVEYNYYAIYFLYWYSDPNSADDKVKIGWIEEDLNGNPFETVVNYGNKSPIIDVPIFYFSSVGRIGKISIKNNTDNYLQIYANGQLIEECILSGQPSQGLSILPSNGGSFTYKIQEDDYIFEAKAIKSDNLVDTRNFSIIERYNLEWTINNDPIYNVIEIINNASEVITLHELMYTRYLGFKLNINQVKNIKLQQDLKEIKILNYFGKKDLIIPLDSDSITINEF